MLYIKYFCTYLPNPSATGRTWQHILVYQGKELELFCFIFVEVIKKFMGSVFFFGGSQIAKSDQKQQQ